MGVSRGQVEDVNLIKWVCRFALALEDQFPAIRRKVAFPAAIAFVGELPNVSKELGFTGRLERTRCHRGASRENGSRAEQQEANCSIDYKTGQDSPSPIRCEGAGPSPRRSGVGRSVWKRFGHAGGVRALEMID